jgi:hypothetical protein
MALEVLEAGNPSQDLLARERFSRQRFHRSISVVCVTIPAIGITSDSMPDAIG